MAKDRTAGRGAGAASDLGAEEQKSSFLAKKTEQAEADFASNFWRWHFQTFFFFFAISPSSALLHQPTSPFAMTAKPAYKVGELDTAHGRRVAQDRSSGLAQLSDCASSPWPVAEIEEEHVAAVLFPLSLSLSLFSPLLPLTQPSRADGSPSQTLQSVALQRELVAQRSHSARRPQALEEQRQSDSGTRHVSTLSPLPSSSSPLPVRRSATGSAAPSCRLTHCACPAAVDRASDCLPGSSWSAMCQRAIEQDLGCAVASAFQPSALVYLPLFAPCHCCSFSSTVSLAICISFQPLSQPHVHTAQSLGWITPCWSPVVVPFCPTNHAPCLSSFSPLRLPLHLHLPATVANIGLAELGRKVSVREESVCISALKRVRNSSIFFCLLFPHPGNHPGRAGNAWPDVPAPEVRP